MARLSEICAQVAIGSLRRGDEKVMAKKWRRQGSRRKQGTCAALSAAGCESELERAWQRGGFGGDGVWKAVVFCSWRGGCDVSRVRGGKGQEVESPAVYGDSAFRVSSRDRLSLCMSVCHLHVSSPLLCSSRFLLDKRARMQAAPTPRAAATICPEVKFRCAQDDGSARRELSLGQFTKWLREQDICLTFL